MILVWHCFHFGLFQDHSPTRTVKFDDMPEAVDIIVEVTRKRDNAPMRFRLSIKACYEEATGTTEYPSTSSGSTSSVYPSTSSLSSSVYSSSASLTASSTSGYPSTTSVSSSPYSSPSSLTSAYPSTSSVSSSVYTSSSGLSSGPTTSVYITPTTVCTVEEGMDEPKFIPDNNIRDNKGRVPDNVQRLRPGSKNPFTVDKDTVTIRFLFNPAIPVESLELIQPKNVDSITVTYRTPRKPNQDQPVVEVISSLTHCFHSHRKSECFVDARLVRTLLVNKCKVIQNHETILGNCDHRCITLSTLWV